MRYFEKISFLVISLTTFTMGQTFSQLPDSLYVWAHPSLNIRQTPDPNSEIISFIPFGEKIRTDWSELNDEIKLTEALPFFRQS